MKPTKIANEKEIEPGMTDYQADIVALAYILRDVTDSLQALYGFCSSMFDIHWPCSEYFNAGEKYVSYAKERLTESGIFDRDTRKFMKTMTEEENGTGAGK